MLTVVNTDRFDAIGLAVNVQLHRMPWPVNQYFQDYSWTNDFRPGWRMDVLFNDKPLDFLLAHESAYNLMGCISGLGEMKVRIGDIEPRTTHGYDWIQDWRKYGNIASSLLYFGRDYHPSASSWSRENEVWHTSARGSVRLDSTGRCIFPNRLSVDIGGGVTAPEYVPHGSPAANTLYTKLVFSRSAGLDVFNVYTGDPVALYPTGPGYRFDVLELVTALKGKTVTIYPSSGYSKNVCEYWNFAYSSEERLDGGHGRLEYYFKNTAWVAENHPQLSPPLLAIDVYHVVVDVDLSVELSTPYSQPLVGVPIDVNTYMVGARKTLTRYYELLAHQISHPTPAGYPYPSGESGYENSAPTVSTVHVLEKGGPARNEPPPFWTRPSYIGIDSAPECPTLAFERWVKGIHDGIRPAAALSANDCLKNYSSSSNFLESLPELPQMIRGIKDISKFAYTLKKLAKGDPEAAGDIIDFLASGYLYYKYGLHPLGSDVAESKRIAERYYDQMGILSAGLPSVIYGSFNYRIPEKVPGIPGTVDVTVRSKMVLRSNPAGILAWVITLDDIGIFPTMARIWDLVPFSFVVDWFTGLSQKFQAIDNNAIRMVLDLDYYTHSFEYRLNLDPRFYSPFHGTATAKTHLRVYIREKSLFHPIVRDGKYDFLPPRGVKKNLLAAGALLWVLK